MKILLTDGSGLTSRQVSTILGRKGHIVHVLSPSTITLTYFTRWVKRVHPVPPFGNDSYVWLEAALEVLRKEKFDILICTQEQVAIISAEEDQIRELGVKVAVPEFKALRKVMDKISAADTLRQAGLPQPESMIIDPNSDLLICEAYLPGYIKTPIGTASTGVRRVGTVQDLQTSRASFLTAGNVDHSGRLLVQKELPGTLIMITSVFSHGQLLAYHAVLRMRTGTGGGASKKVSLPLPIIGEHMASLGKLLNWHGAISLDAILPNGSSTPQYIDINPRIVEPMNALLSGVDIVDILLKLSLGTHEDGGTKPPLRGMEGVETHQLLLALLGAAQKSRVVLIGEIFRFSMRFDPYAGSEEELTPFQGDVLSFFVIFVMMIMLLVGGRGMAERLSRSNIRNYAVSAEGWERIVSREKGKRNHD